MTRTLSIRQQSVKNTVTTTLSIGQRSDPYPNQTVTVLGMKTKDNPPRTHFEQIPVHIAKKIAKVTPRIDDTPPTQTPSNVVIEKSSAKTEPYSIRNAPPPAGQFEN